MALTSATATISSAGIGSGLDVNSIVTQLMAVERQPLTKLQAAGATLQTQVSAFGQMQSAIAALHDAAAPLFAADSFAATSSSSSDPNGVSAATTTKAVPGTYSVSVTALSASQAVVSPSGQYSASTDVVGSGSLTITLGSWSAGNTVFTPKGGATAITIPIGATENTLAGIRDKFNAANAGVSASLVTDATGTRIAFSSSKSGLDNAFRVTVVDDDAGNTDALGLSRLAYEPAAKQMTLAQAAANTEATINGIAVSAAGNSLVDVVDGMTFSLAKVTTAPVTVNVTRNTDAIKNQVARFVTAYNQLNKFLSDATKYDPATKQAALLQGDGTTVGIQNQLRSLLAQSSGASVAFGTLSSIGVQLQKDGSLKLDDAKFNTALTNLPELTKALSNVDATVPANNGFAKKFALWTDQLLSVAGSVPGKTKALQARIASNQKDQDRLADRLESVEKRMRAQYSALDSTMASANALSKYVTQQIATWNKNTA
jgi:flagellar hook-associated protein 2